MDYLKCMKWKWIWMKRQEETKKRKEYCLQLINACRCVWECFCVEVVGYGFHNLLISVGRWWGLSSELSESHTCCFAPAHCEKTTTHCYTLETNTPELNVQQETHTHILPWLWRGVFCPLSSEIKQWDLVSFLFCWLFSQSHTHTHHAANSTNELW